MGKFPLAYHITFTTYGTRLHGGDSGSVDPKHNVPGTPVMIADPDFARFNREELKQFPYMLDEPRRKLVMEAIKEVCEYRGWKLYAAHVRDQHVHTVVKGDVEPEKIMKDFKAYSSRKLNERGFDNKDRKRWTRHGSTQYKWSLKEVKNAINYVVREQGEPMEVFESGEEFL
jgi:REP element-mobilizing transposase RayT